MKVHKVIVYVIDHDGLGADGVKEEMERVKYPNYCMNPHVHSIETADCGEWSDDHPLNKVDTHEAELIRLFGK